VKTPAPTKGIQLASPDSGPVPTPLAPIGGNRPAPKRGAAAVVKSYDLSLVFDDLFDEQSPAPAKKVKLASPEPGPVRTALSPISGNQRGLKRGAALAVKYTNPRITSDDSSKHESFSHSYNTDLAESSDDEISLHDCSDDEDLNIRTSLELNDEDAEPIILDRRGLKKFPDPYIDENGLIRLGKQPLQPSPRIYTAPLNQAIYQVSFRIGDCVRRDARAQGISKDTRSKIIQEAVTKLSESVISCREGWVKVLCDYTGLEMSWAPGPRRASLEAPYHFTVVDGVLRYHALPNLCLIMGTINRAKTTHPSTVLPLVAEWIRVYDRKTAFGTWIGKLAWLYNALTNAAIMSKVFVIQASRTDLFPRVNGWSVSRKRMALETLRTGSRSEQFDSDLSQVEEKDVFFTWKRTPDCQPNWADEDQILRKIAQQYGISAEEFDDYLTIPAPNNNGRVFYPFHVLSRPQALSVGWDWTQMHEICCWKLHVMRKVCNKNGERHGFGEEADGLRVMYWMAAHFSKLIQGLKQRYAGATRREIAFRILDRWGLPLVPWARHAFVASLCKKQDHGIAMLFGLTNSEETFDPLRHIDLSRCTITLDTWFTNIGMFDYHPELWDECRTLISHVPLHHALFRVDSTMGDEPWIGQWDQSIMLQRPQAQFRIQLLPVDPWVSGRADHLTPVACQECTESFQSIGALVQHCREYHPLFPVQSKNPLNESNEQDDTEYWRNLNRCTICGEQFYDHTRLERHMRVHSKLRFDCEICQLSFTREAQLEDHMREAHGSFTCEICNMSFARRLDLAEHVREIHTEKRNIFRCDTCGKEFARKNALDRHVRAKHGDGWHCEICGEHFSIRNALDKHRKEAHPEAYPQKDKEPIVCEICGKHFNRKHSLTEHMKGVHLNIKAHVCDTCGLAFAKKSVLNRHLKRFSGTDGHPEIT
jgi:hypothetical protein